LLLCKPSLHRRRLPSAAPPLALRHVRDALRYGMLAANRKVVFSGVRTIMPSDPIPSRADRLRLRHAVFPVAGFGADFLPATKACPKELLPIVDRPLIQYAVEEAAAAGFTHMILITGRHKRAIEDHFDQAYELERELGAQTNAEALRALHAAIPKGVTFTYVRQPQATGLLDALCKVRSLLANAPFALVLPDQLIDSPRPALAQLLDVFEAQQMSVVGAGCTPPTRADPLDTPRARLIAAALDASAISSERSLVKIPPIGAASLPIEPIGRFIFTPAVWPALERAAVDGAHDPRLVRTIRALMERERVFACLVDGRQFDCGSQLGFLEAQFAYAQKSADLWDGLCRSYPELRRRSARRRRMVAAPATDADRIGEGAAQEG
jgi:UTP--glucose-1-phosphate uridylyltransferase